MRVLVCGGRTYGNQDYLDKILNQIHATEKITEIISGGARGADTCAIVWAEKAKVKCSVYYADWDKHGKAAGHIRNKEMLIRGNPDIIVAFPGGAGTRDMISLAYKHKIPLINLYVDQ